MFLLTKQIQLNIIVFLVLLNLSFSTKGQVHPPEIPTATVVETYKEVGSTNLKAWIFNPSNHQEGAKKPAIIFFFGGGWRQGTPTQFVKHCEYLSARGMVAITVDYRVANRHKVKVKDCVSDAKSAIRWARKNAKRLGIDPNRIIAAGGSAGGHLAASTATLADHYAVTDDLSVSAIPNALVLFNPVLVLTNIPEKFELSKERIENLGNRMGASIKSMSPYHHIKPEIGPSIIFHGTADNTVPFITAELFHQAMSAKGNQCTLVAYQGEGHGFFNYGRNNNGAYIDSVNKLDAFLVEIGYLQTIPNNRTY